MEHNSPKECQSAPCPAPGWDSLHNGRTAAAILWLIIAGGVILRTYGLYGRSMWFDESASWRIIQFPFAEMIARTARDNHVPLYFVLLRLWTAIFGASIVALRNFSLAFSALAMLGVYLFTVEVMAMNRDRAPGERGADARARWIGLVATSLFGVSLFQIRMAWEIRMYSLGTALAMFSSWLLVRALTAKPQRGLPWMFYMLSALGFAYTHYCALFSLFAQGLFALAYLLSGLRWNLKAALKDAGFRWFALAYAGVAAGWSPWLPQFLEQRRRVAAGWYNDPFSIEHVAEICYKMFFHPEVHGWVMSYMMIVAGFCPIVVLAMLWKGRAGQWCVACLAVVPFALIWLVSSVSSNLMLDRYMAFLQPFLLIAMASALWRIPIGVVRDLIAYAVVAAGLALHVDFVDSLNIANRPGASAAASYIDAQRRPGEPVIACSPLLMFPTLFHSRQREGWRVYSNQLEISFYAGGSILTPEDVFSAGDMDKIRTERVWVITSSGSWAGWGMYIPPTWISISRQQFREVYGFQYDVVVVCYRTR